MLPRPPSVHQSPAETPPTPIGVGIDTSRYGHYAASLNPDLLFDSSLKRVYIYIHSSVEFLLSR